MTKRVWKKGPPPHIGWWNASNTRNQDSWRWWNGKNWSYAAFNYFTPKYAASIAAKQRTWVFTIEWTDYWPENARVPRIKP